VEVIIFWGGEILDIRQVDSGRSFFIGEDVAGVDFVVPCEGLGWRRAPLVQAVHGRTMVVLPPGVRGTVHVRGESQLDSEDAIALGRTAPCSEVHGGHMLEPREGTQVRIHLGPLSFLMTAYRHQACPTLRTSSGSHGGVAFTMALSMLAHAALLGTLLMSTPPFDRDGASQRAEDGALVLSQYLMATSENQLPPEPEEGEVDTGHAGTNGKCLPGKQMGLPLAKRQGRYGVEGPRDNPDPHIAVLSGSSEVNDSHAIASLQLPAANAPSMPWARDEALGTDVVSARGTMWADDVQDAWGLGGMAMSGTCGSCGGGGGVSAAVWNEDHELTARRVHRSPVTARFVSIPDQL
jgi:hypothetical protein